MPETTFSEKGWSQYTSWQTEDRKTLKKINDLIKDILRNGYLNGIGKPEILKGTNGEYSRRIDDTNRLVYSGDEKGNVRIIACKGHYDD